MRILRGAAVAAVIITLLAGCSNSTTPAAGNSPKPTKTATAAAVAQLPVPNVVGLHRKDAYATIQNRGLAAVVENPEVMYQPPYTQDPLVTQQTPAAGTTVAEGTVIYMTLDEAAVPAPTPTPTPVAPPPPPETVVYSVTGDGVGGASISYIVPNGSFGQEQANGVGLPWSKEIPITGSNNVYVLTAQGNGGGGSITCSITVRGHVRSTQTSTGSYAVVTCSG